MADKFQNKYRIPSARLQHWDYGWNAAYFVTICTKNRECFFGKIENGIMNLSGSGIIADVFWYEIKNHATNVDLGEFVVMPNHIHGIIILNGNDSKQTGAEKKPYENNQTDILNNPEDLISDSMDGAIDGTLDDPAEGSVNGVETRHALSLRSEHSNTSQSPEPQKTIGQQRFQNQGANTLSSIIGGYKSAVTKHANRLKLNFAWQTSFHDHVIRDDKSFQNISAYIKNNPSNWKDDKFNR